MGLLQWFRRDGLRRDRRRRRSRRRRKPSPQALAVAELKGDVVSLRSRLDQHDTQLADLTVRTSDERLEQTVAKALNRLVPSGARPFVGGSEGSRVRTVGTAATRPVYLTISPAQRAVLDVLTTDGGDRYLSYADMGQLLGKSPTAVKHLVNQIKKRGVPLEGVVSTNNQARYRLTSKSAEAVRAA